MRTHKSLVACSRPQALFRASDRALHPRDGDAVGALSYDVFCLVLAAGVNEEEGLTGTDDDDDDDTARGDITNNNNGNAIIAEAAGGRGGGGGEAATPPVSRASGGGSAPASTAASGDAAPGGGGGAAGGDGGRGAAAVRRPRPVPDTVSMLLFNTVMVTKLNVTKRNVYAMQCNVI